MSEQINSGSNKEELLTGGYIECSWQIMAAFCAMTEANILQVRENFRPKIFLNKPCENNGSKCCQNANLEFEEKTLALLYHIKPIL